MYNKALTAKMVGAFIMLKIRKDLFESDSYRTY